ncbi:putative NUDIX hydrolase [Sporotomaculum syntrophicum]|uniref:NUDIX hydrolase n=1 Tax=Sporotomaculum syntrophicum TaxID=182264 RepID=A0A9D3AZC9_9FIRM|nr:CoA pyrophosphatase [Sporotomaculum syntrophicum]KAF1085754.1 putative NUDIX hydrolase [Sporotomaculum syntrophicum]
MTEDKIRKKLMSNKPDLMIKDHYLVSEVLLPLVQGASGLELLFEVRSMNLSRQPGEICFPGGHVEEIESSRPGSAALREASEELGLSFEDIVPIGSLDRLITPFGVLVHPFVGRILSPEHIEPNRSEVDKIFTVPLSFLQANPPQVSSLEVATRYSPDFPIDRVPEKYRGGWTKRWSLPAYIYEYQNYFIWGMTALILHNFLSIITKE